LEIRRKEETERTGSGGGLEGEWTKAFLVSLSLLLVNFEISKLMEKPERERGEIHFPFPFSPKDFSNPLPSFPMS